MGKKARILLISTLIGVAGFLLAYFFSCSGLSRKFELYTYDSRVEFRNTCFDGKWAHPVHPDVVLIGIDDRVVQYLGKRSWENRLNHAYMLQYLADHFPKVVGFDILFKTPETGDARDHDVQLLNRIAMFERDTICMAYFFPDDQPEEPTEDEGLLKRFEIADVSNVPPDYNYLKESSLPFNALASDGNVSLGFINAPRDPDGAVRSLPMVIGLETVHEGQMRRSFYPSISLLMSCRYLGVPLERVAVDFGEAVIIPIEDGPDIRIPIDENGRHLVNFCAGHKGFHPISFVQLVASSHPELKDSVPADIGPELIEDKILLVGLTATGSTDENPTPVGAVTPLVTVHLNAISSILNRDFIHLSPEWLNVSIFAVLSVGLGLFSGLLRPIKATIVSVAVLGTYLGGCYGIFVWSATIIPVVPPVLAMVLVFSTTMVYRFLTEERQKLWIRKVLGQYLSANVMREVLEDPDKLKLGGVRKNLTVLFSDIRGFTPICEKLPPEKVTQVLNEYLDEMTECVFKHSGTLDKYVGDEIVAFFGAPGDEHADDHPRLAVETALEMRKRLLELQPRWVKEGKEKLDSGIGINTGDMLVGNMGSSNIFDYTVIGDAVNLGARIEALTREYNVPIIITEFTYERVRDFVETRDLGVAKVKGKEQGVRVYEVLCLKNPAAGSAQQGQTS